MDPLFLAWQMTALVSCLLAATAMLVFFFKFPSTRVHPGPVLLCVFLSVCIANLSRVALLTWHSYGGKNHVPVTYTAAANTELTAEIPGLESYVAFFFWCDFFFETAATMWYLMLALDLIFSLSNPFLPFHADNVKHHVFAWPMAMLWCLTFRYVFENTDRTASNNIMLYMHLPALGVLLYVMLTLLLSWRRSRCLEAQAHHTTRLMAKRILPYLAVFATDTALIIGLYLVQVSVGKDTTTASAVDQLALVLEALCLFVLFSRDTGVFAALRRSPPPPRSDNSGHVPLTAAAGDATPPPTGNTEGRDNAETLDVGLELRMCVMKYMSMGIFAGIEEAEKAAARDADSCSREVVFDDYNRVEAMSIVVHGELASGVLNFRDCAPKVFHQIREQFKIDPQLYKDSFDVSKYVDLRRQMKEKGSEGKSGNIFYFTANDQFMVKSVPKEEFDTLRAILPHYHRYLLSNPQSMLCRYFGCHSISLPVGKRRMYFVVMQNLFNDGAVHQRFDLKGNRDRRQAIGTSQVENYIQLAKEQQTIKKLMMDIDFRKFNGGIAATLNTATKLQGQLCDDVVFLASRGIIDYSILLGVRYFNGSERFPSLAAHSSGFYANDGEKIYYVGLVDMLQRYNWRWTVQRWFLGLLCKDTHDVSAVPPKEYGDRLTDFVRSRLFDIQHSSNPRLSRMAGIGSGGSNPAVLSVHGNDADDGYAGYHHRRRVGSEGTYHTTVDMDNDVRPSACLRELALSSPSSDSHHSLFRNSTSSSPSVAYSSVGESPASMGKPTFFV